MTFTGTIRWLEFQKIKIYEKFLQKSRKNYCQN